ncbi:MAG: MBL fold metallo-hydrolase, partial [Verrucomicrobiota bacterium]
MLVVLNKIDLCSPEQRRAVAQHFDRPVCVSLKTGEGVDDLQQRLSELLLDRTVRLKLRLPQSAFGLMTVIHEQGKLLGQEYDGNDVLVEAVRPGRGAAQFLPTEDHPAAARERMGDGAAIEYLTVEEGGTREVGVFRFTAVAAAHNEIERDGLGRCRFLSFVVRFGPFCVWHSGDTLWHDGLVAELRAARPDLVMVPINGNDPARRVAGNLNGTEAAALAKACGARLAVPHHFGMFAFNTADPREFVEACGRLQQPCRVLRGGESLTLGQSSSDVVGGAVD